MAHFSRLKDMMNFNNLMSSSEYHTGMQVGDIVACEQESLVCFPCSILSTMSTMFLVHSVHVKA